MCHTVADLINQGGKMLCKTSKWLYGIILVTLLLPQNILAAATVKERESGVTFPKMRKWDKYNMIALGTALREKLFIDVYAGCLYVDKESGKKSFLEFLNSPQAKGAYANGKLNKRALFSNQAFYDWLINSDLPITIDMTFLRDVGVDKVKETYKEGLLKYMQPSPLVDRFVQMPKVDIKEWKHISLNMLPGGKVVFQYMDTTHPPIISKPLARALLSIYFGNKPINEKVKQGLVKYIDWLLN